MRSIFIADAHLRDPADDNYRTLLRFLESIDTGTDTLFILGDLFEFWIGYPHCAFPQYLPVIEAFRRLRQAGVAIEYFEGNHDFHLGPVFEKDLTVSVHPGPVTREISGKRVYLCHGDQINVRDHAYRLQRLVFHSPLTRMLTKLIPPQAAQLIAAKLSQMSRRKHGQRRTKWDYPTIITDFAEQKFREGIDVVITGHFHLPLLQASATGTLVSLGDWINDFTYAECDESGFSLRTFR